MEMMSNERSKPKGRTRTRTRKCKNEIREGRNHARAAKKKLITGTGHLWGKGVRRHSFKWMGGTNGGGECVRALSTPFDERPMREDDEGKTDEQIKYTGCRMSRSRSRSFGRQGKSKENTKVL